MTEPATDGSGMLAQDDLEAVRRLREAFACGTAAVVTPIGTIRSKDGEFKIGNGGPGTKTEELKAALVGIQRGRAADPHGWIHKVF